MYSDAAITTTMLGKRPCITLSGDVEVLVKRSKLSGSARSISPNEAILPRPSIPVIDLTGDDGKPKLSMRVEVPNKELKFSRDAGNPASSCATPNQSPIQIIDLTDDELDLDRLIPREIPAYNPIGEFDKPIPKREGQTISLANMTSSSLKEYTI